MRRWDKVHFQSAIWQTGITIVLLALGYVSLYGLNATLIGTEAFNGVAAWLFLPAFVRLLGFLLIGFWSVPALFVAALICVDLSLSPASQILVSFFLAIGAPLALWSVSNLVGVDLSLKNLSGSQILVLSVAAALGSGASYHIGLTLVGVEVHSPASFVTAAFGDAAGTWAVIYILKMLVTVVSRALLPKI